MMCALTQPKEKRFEPDAPFGPTVCTIGGHQWKQKTKRSRRKEANAFLLESGRDRATGKSGKHDFAVDKERVAFTFETHFCRAETVNKAKMSCVCTQHSSCATRKW